MTPKITRLPDAELQIMQTIWNNETPISTTQVKEYLEEQKPWNVSALQTLLNRLIDRGFLKSEKQGKNRYYESLILEEEYLAYENKRFLKKLNSSSVTRLVASLYNSNAISDEDLEELKTFIEEKTGGES